MNGMDPNQSRVSSNDANLLERRSSNTTKKNPYELRRFFQTVLPPLRC